MGRASWFRVVKDRDFEVSDGSIGTMPKRGHIGTSMGGIVRVRRPKCPHKWTPWAKAGIFDSTMRRDCLKCKRIQTKRT